MIDSQIIKIASDTSNYGIKRKSDFIATSKNKNCGDKITIELEVINKVIKRMNYETESCIFCQASASLLSKLIRYNNINKLSSFLEIAKKNKKFKKIFKNKERISCTMLPFKTLQKFVNYTL
jgi:nitrogen fixation NifU-like protein